MNLNFFPQDEQFLLLQLRSLEGHHVEEGLAVFVPAVYELLQVGGLRVDKLARPQHVRHQVLVAQLGGNHHGVVSWNNNSYNVTL